MTEHSTVIAVCLLSSPFLTNGFTVDSLSPLHHYAGEKHVPFGNREPNKVEEVVCWEGEVDKLPAIDLN